MLVGLAQPVELCEQTEIDQFWMQQALKLADQAALTGEVPVAAILVHQGQCIAAAFNQPIQRCDPTAHAEILVLRAAGERLQNYRLVDTCLYVTLEPCAMCAGALVNARVRRVVYAAPEPRSGAAGSIFQILHSEQLNHRCELVSGVLSEVASEQLKQFFKARR